MLQPLFFTLSATTTESPPISMGNKLPSFGFSVFLIIQFTLTSSAYTPDVLYFLNCGSDSIYSNSLEPERSFISDSPYLKGSQKTVKISNVSAANTTLYQTARVFRDRKSFYKYTINKQGTYIVRFHFFSFSSPDHDLSRAVFTIRASGFPLLSNFSIPKKNSLVIEEFLLSINQGKLYVYFMPSNESSFAFVNAIEVFLAPERFFPDYTEKVASSGIKGNKTRILFENCLHKIHRINVGGSMYIGISDSLWRKWIADDDFLLYPENARDLTPFEGTLMGRLRVTEEIAPDFVYKTAKELNEQQNASNITWGFNVRKNTEHFVRFHFCDITGAALGNVFFDLRIFDKFSKKISSEEQTNITAAPFYFDYVVESNNDGFLNVSVHKRNDSNVQNAFLNGLEIMEIIQKSGPDPEPHENKKNHQVVIVGPVVVFLLIILVLVIVFLKAKKSKRYRKPGRPFSMPLYGGNFSERNANIVLPPELNLDLKIPYSEIRRATKNFSSKLLIGEGGFGKVYKGTLREGRKVAVKRSEPGHGQGKIEFETEVMILSQIQHRHLVSLIGYCDEKSEMILVYEFMEKGTLREHLYTSDSTPENNFGSRSELSWEERLKICIGSAEGIHYLHTGLLNRIIHRDLKSTNILLTEDYRAKVADFGLSKAGPLDPDDYTGLKGSFGYLDPEYFMTSQLTEKSDVYSFGVVLLEVLCARPAIFKSEQNVETNLAEWAMSWLKKGQLEDIIDPGLVGATNPSSLRKFGETAEKCLRGSSRERPIMQDVIWDLKLALEFQMGSEKDDISMTSNSLGLKVVEKLPSQKDRVEEDESFAGGGDDTFSMASGVFSQIKIHDGR